MAELKLRKYFSGKKLTSTWDIAGNAHLSIPDLTAWLLDEAFLLFTGRDDQAQHLIIASNGGYTPSTESIPIPQNTEFVCLGPHSWELYDFHMKNIAKKRAISFAFVNKLETNFDLLPFLRRDTSRIVTLKPVYLEILSGTSRLGHIRNYSLSKFLGFEEREKSYRSIADLVSRSRMPATEVETSSSEAEKKPIGIETIYNRFDILTVPCCYELIDSSLKNLFQLMEEYGITYERITLLFFSSHELTSMPHCNYASLLSN